MNQPGRGVRGYGHDVLMIIHYNGNFKRVLRALGTHHGLHIH